MTPRFVVIDTETTGFSNDSRILEIGMVFSEDGVVVDTWRQRFNPKGVNWDSPGVQSAQAVHGIGPSDLVGCPDFAEAAPVVRMFLSRYKVWVGHNLNFDLRMLGLEFNRIGVTKWGREEAFPLCTMEMAKYLDSIERTKNSHKLDATAARLGVKLANAHTAVGDATATAEIVFRLAHDKRLPFRVASVLNQVLATERAACGG